MISKNLISNLFANMTNHFRSFLMNLPDNGTVSDYIAPNFGYITLSGDIADFYNLIYPVQTRSAIVAQTNAYTRLVESAGLDEIFTRYDSRITYTKSDLNEFKTIGTNLASIASSVIDSYVCDSIVGLSNADVKCVGMYLNSPINMQRLASIICCYANVVGAYTEYPLNT